LSQIPKPLRAPTSRSPALAALMLPCFESSLQRSAPAQRVAFWQPVLLPE